MVKGQKDRLSWLKNNQITLLVSDQRLTQLFTEYSNCFYYGLFRATIILAIASVERALYLELLRQNKRNLEEISFGGLINDFSKCNISSSIIADLIYLNKIRINYLHQSDSKKINQNSQNDLDFYDQTFVSLNSRDATEFLDVLNSLPEDKRKNLREFANLSVDKHAKEVILVTQRVLRKLRYIA